MPKLMVTIDSKETEVQTDDFTEEQTEAHNEVVHIQREIDRNDYINQFGDNTIRNDEILRALFWQLRKAHPLIHRLYNQSATK